MTAMSKNDGVSLNLDLIFNSKDKKNEENEELKRYLNKLRVRIVIIDLYRKKSSSILIRSGLDCLQATNTILT